MPEYQEGTSGRPSEEDFFIPSPDYEPSGFPPSPMELEEQMGRLRAKQINELSEKEMSKLEKETEIKKGDTVVCIKGNGDRQNYHWKEGLILVVEGFTQENRQATDGKLTQVSRCYDGQGRKIDLDLVRMATDKEIRRYKKMGRLRKSIRKTDERKDLENHFKSQGLDIREIDKLELNHPDQSERDRKHNPPTDKKGLKESDLKIE